MKNSSPDHASGSTDRSQLTFNLTTDCDKILPNQVIEYGERE
jgi:hypothetical protein